MKNEKQKAIEKAYRNRYNDLKEFINEDGVFVGDTDMISDIEFHEWSFITNAKPLNAGKLISGSRPSSLKNIENNNNWISINSEKDLPKEKTMFEFIPCNKFDEKFIGWIDLSLGEVFFIDFRNYKITKSEKHLSETNAWLTNQITHYREIKNSDNKNPIY